MATTSAQGAAVALNTQDDQWLYASAAPDHVKICRIEGNIALQPSARRERELHHFAGRHNPVAYFGEARWTVWKVSGLLDENSSSVHEWEKLIRESEVLLIRDSLGRRMHASVEEIESWDIGPGLQGISFTATQVDT